LDVSKLVHLGWEAKTGLQQGVKETYTSFLADEAAGRLRV
jgi:nucleoside-diphosphate-sugar epimerase